MAASGCITAARHFFTQALKQHGAPEKVTADAYPASHTAISELKIEEVLPQSTKVRTSKYSNASAADVESVTRRLMPGLTKHPHAPLVLFAPEPNSPARNSYDFHKIF
jgi:transposase-like protein